MRALCVVCLLVCASGARAQEEEARALFQGGVRAAAAERWDEAIDQFQRSLALVERPGTIYNLAVALDRAGRAREAVTALDGYFQIAPSDDPRMTEAQALRTDLASRVPTLTLTVSPEDATVHIDGSLREGSGAQRTYTLDPGAHTIVVSADGYTERSIDVSATGGPIAETVALAPGEGSARSSGSGGIGTLGIVGIATAGAGLAAGAIAIATGVMARSIYDELDQRCGTSPCPPGNEGDIEEGRTLASVSIALAVIAGAAGIAGVTLFAIDLSSDGATAALELRPNGAALRARF
jgi:hypothetical protein